MSLLCLYNCIVLKVTHTHPFNVCFSKTTRVSRYQKGKTNLFLLKQETVSGSGISWAICKSAPHSIQITMPATHHSVFTGRMPFLPPNRVKALKGIKVTQVTANHCGRQARGGEYYRLAINISGVKLFFCKTKPQSSYAHSVPFKIHVVIRLKW